MMRSQQLPNVLQNSSVRQMSAIISLFMEYLWKKKKIKRISVEALSAVIANIPGCASISGVSLVFFVRYFRNFCSQLKRTFPSLSFFIDFLISFVLLLFPDLDTPRFPKMIIIVNNNDDDNNNDNNNSC